MKKRILALALGVLMAASLAGCSKELSNEYISIKKYEGLEVAQAETMEVTDEMVEGAVNSSLSAAATSEEIKDRAAQEGDTVNVDFKGSIDGVEFEGGAATGADIVLGEGTLIGATDDHKGFEEQIVGHKTGENFDITVQFPAEYLEAPDKQNKVAVFNITLNRISVSTVPELTDKWVKENSEKSKTTEEYKKEIKKQLEDSNKQSAESAVQNGVMEVLIDEIEVKKFPKGAVDEQLKSIEEYYGTMAEAYGLEFKEFAKQYMNLSEEEFNKQAKEAAESAVKRRVACELIAKKEKLEPTDKEYKKEIEEFAKGSGYEDVETFKQEVGEDVLKNTILQQNVAEYLAEKCVQVEQKDTGKDTGSKK